MKISWTPQILFGFFLAATSFCFAGNSAHTLTPLISYKHYGEEDGLHCKTVYEVIQDKEGFLWFATDAGAFRFDGKIFKQYNIENGVTDKEVLKIFQDSYGRIWFLTLNGYLSFWKDGKIYNPSNTPFLKKAYINSSIFSYYEDTRQRVWLGTPAHIYIVIDRDSVRLIKCPYEGYTDSVRLGSIYIHEDANGNMWSFSDKKMFRFADNKAGDTLQIPFPVVDGFLCRKNKSSQFFYLPKEGGVYKLSDKSVSLYADKSNVLYQSSMINMVYDNGNLWFCTRGKGCYQMIDGKISAKYFEKSVITSVFRDRENNLWFNTMGEGVYMLPSSAHFVKNYNQQSGLAESNVTSLALGIKGALWLGYTNGAVARIENSRSITFMPEQMDKLGFNRVVSLAVDSDVVFCATDMGAYFILGDKARFIELNPTPGHSSYSVKQVFISDKRNVYFTHSTGIVQAVKTGSGYYAKDILDSLTRMFAITQYPDSQLLVSVPDGIVEYKGERKLMTYQTDIDFSSVRILDMKPARDSLLALATNGRGIYFLKGTKLYQHLSSSNGLSDNNCKRIFVTDSMIYIATDQGLNVLKYEQGKWKFAEVMTAKNALLSNTVNDVAEKDGIIYLATEKGFSEFNKEILFRKKFISEASVTEIVTDSTIAVTSSSYHFNADIPRLRIKFSCPVFDPANDLKVRYRLLRNKTDQVEWTVSETNEVEFSSLSPGDYIFQLKPDANRASITNFYIHIIPLWWQTTLARIAFCLVIIGLITLIIRRRIQLQYKKQLQQLKLLEAERSRIASDMHDDIGADLTQLSIWSGILRSSEKKDTNVLERITSSSYEVLQKMDQIIWALNSFHNQTQDLTSYLREYASQYLESAGINLSFQTPSVIPELKVSAIQKRNIFLTVKELLHNTVKHSGASNVSIRIYYADSFLYIEYTDNGKGFTPKPREDGMGNITMQKRMQEINSTILVKSGPSEGFSAVLKITLVTD